MNPIESDAHIRQRRRELDQALRRAELLRAAGLHSGLSPWRSHLAAGLRRTAGLHSGLSPWRSHLAAGLRRTADLLDGCGAAPRWAR